MTRRGVHSNLEHQFRAQLIQYSTASSPCLLCWRGASMSIRWRPYARHLAPRRLLRRGFVPPLLVACFLAFFLLDARDCAHPEALEGRRINLCPLACSNGRAALCALCPMHFLTTSPYRGLVGSGSFAVKKDRSSRAGRVLHELPTVIALTARLPFMLESPPPQVRPTAFFSVPVLTHTRTPPRPAAASSKTAPRAPSTTASRCASPRPIAAQPRKKKWKRTSASFLPPSNPVRTPAATRDPPEPRPRPAALRVQPLVPALLHRGRATPQGHRRRLHRGGARRAPQLRRPQGGGAPRLAPQPPHAIRPPAAPGRPLDTPSSPPPNPATAAAHTLGVQLRPRLDRLRRGDGGAAPLGGVPALRGARHEGVLRGAPPPRPGRAVRHVPPPGEALGPRRPEGRATHRGAPHLDRQARPAPPAPAAGRLALPCLALPFLSLPRPRSPAF